MARPLQPCWHALVAEGLRNVAASAAAVELNKENPQQPRKVVEELKARATEVSSSAEIANVATFSRDTQIGEMVSGAMDKVGKDGVVTVEESQSIDSYVDVTEGISFEKGYLSPYFMTDTEARQAVLSPCAMLVRSKIYAPCRTSSTSGEGCSGQQAQPVTAEEVDWWLPLNPSELHPSDPEVVAVPEVPYFGDERQ